MANWPLFNRDQLSGYLDKQLDRIREDVSSWSADALANAAEADRGLQQRFGVRPIGIDLESVHTQVPDDPNGKIAVEVPFTGNPIIFELRPSRSTSMPPMGEVRGSGASQVATTPVISLASVVRIEYDGNPSAADAEKIKQWRTEQLRELSKWVEWANADIEEFQGRVAQVAPELVAQRKAKLTDRLDVPRAIAS